MSTQSEARVQAPNGAPRVAGTTKITWAFLLEVSLPNSGKFVASYTPGATGLPQLAIARNGSEVGTISEGLNPPFAAEAGDTIIIPPGDAQGMTLTYYYV